MATPAHPDGDKTFLKINTFATRESEKASDLLQSIYDTNDVWIDVEGNAQEFSMRTTCVAFGELTLVRSDVSSWGFSRDLSDLVLIKMPLYGSPVNYTSGRRRQIAYSRRGACVGRPFETVSMTRERGGGLSLYAPISQLAERAETLTGTTCGSRSIAKMVDYIDMSTPVGAALARAAGYALAEMTGLNSIGLGFLAVAGLEDRLLNLAVGSLFPSVIQDVGSARSFVLPRVIRRARDYIAEHATEPIDLARLARDLGINMRTMQENFRKCYGFSARDYILDCRLEQARQRLQSADKTTSVTQSALASGFTDLGHFSAKYRAKFGELPSETLRFALRRHY